MSEAYGAELTSLRSPRVKAARQLAKRAMRERARLFLAEGPQAAGEALARDGVVTELFLTAAARSRHGGMAARASRQGAAVHVVSGEIMAELAQTVTPQGVLAVCRFVDVPLATLTASAPRLVVILANVRDPGNAGTVLRTADAAGAGGVIFSDASVDPYNSKCVRASRLSRVPWNFGGGPFDHQAAFWSSFWLTAVTFLKCASSAARSFGRCR